MGKEKDEACLVSRNGKSLQRFNIFIDKTGKIHLPLDFPGKKEFIDSIKGEKISESLKKSGDFCG